ncbi:MAG TPA: hypothetical protein VLF43_01460 [Candidatus Saccharimonadales bacterium]|nr:hypothetical protein [Candidatus Saccharimonadales bacterium]
MVSHTKLMGIYFDGKMDSAERLRTDMDSRIGCWLLSRMDVTGLRAGRLAIPTEREWSVQEGARASELPPAPIVLNGMRAKNPEQSGDRLLRRKMWQVIAGLDPAVDPSYVRTHVDEELLQVRLDAVAAGVDAATGTESTDYAIVPRKSKRGSTALGNITMRFQEQVDEPPEPEEGLEESAGQRQVTREAWLDSFTVPAGSVPLAGRLLLAAHIAGAEIAHGEFYTLRTPPRKVLSASYLATWQVLTETTDNAGAHIVTVERPLSPLRSKPEAYYGHLAIPPRTGGV